MRGSGVSLNKLLPSKRIDFKAKLTREEVLAKVWAGVNLKGEDLSGLDLSDSDLSGAYLRGADLGRANLNEADLYGTNLRGANMNHGTLPISPKGSGRISR